ncbi:MAG: phospholipase D-like domain-containing protein [Solirubrobacteraceae bacterium]
MFGSAEGRLGREFRSALLAAAQRGVRVRLLMDAFGSWALPDDFFLPLKRARAGVHYFNPLRPWSFGVRDHRKLLVCDDAMAFVGGYNITDEFDGDGVTRGWCDLGGRITEALLVGKLAASFDELFTLADFHRKPLLRLRAFKRKARPAAAAEFLPSHPGRGASPFQAALHRDLDRAREVRIITAYFLPTRRVRRLLMRAVRNGGRVQLILAGRSDVLVSQLAGRSLYRHLLKAGVEIYEYQPQILHAKLLVIDGAVHLGSSNLDIRSLNLNYELMLRFDDPAIAAGAREIFERIRRHSRRIEPDTWFKSLAWWQRWQYHWARFLVARIDPFVALRQFRAINK